MKPLKVLKKSFIIVLLAYVAKYLIRLILFTCRFEVRGLESYEKALKSAPCIIMLWHNRLGIMSEILYKFTPHYFYAAFISSSRDGEPLAKLANSYKMGRAIRVPHNAKHQALKNVIYDLRYKNETIIMTPDGPKGPRYEVKPGIVMAAKEAQATIIPFSWIATRFWQFKTWDKLLLPKPFSKILVHFGEPILLKNEDKASEEHQGDLRDHLLQIEKNANRELLQNPEIFPK